MSDEKPGLMSDREKTITKWRLGAIHPALDTPSELTVDAIRRRRVCYKMRGIAAHCSALRNECN